MVARAISMYFSLNVVFTLEHAFFLQPGSGKQQMVCSKEVTGREGIVSKGIYFYQEVGRLANEEEMLKLSESSYGEGPSPCA